MDISYSKIYDCCKKKCEELKIKFDFNNNEHMQHPKTMNDIYKNFVYHSQNRSQGCAYNFFKQEENKNVKESENVWKIIENHKFNFDDDFDYINLFNELKENEFIKKSFKLEKGKDIQFLELAKTCQCIKKYLNNYKTFDDFIDAHIFTSDSDNNWSIFKRVADNIYNVGTELVPDFFKEQDCIKGWEYLVKADIHVKRFFRNLFNKENLSDMQVYDKLLELYNESDQKTKQDVPPYKIDKYIYLIGKQLGDPNEAKKFADEVLSYCTQSSQIENKI